MTATEGVSSITFWKRRWTEHSPLPEAQQVAVGIADDLHLDVPRPDDVLFEDNGIVPEGGHGLPSGALHGFRKLAGLRDGAHSPPPTPESGLDEDGIADLPGLLLYGFGF